MDYTITDFCGVLLRTRNGNFAVNGGELPAALAAAYLRSGEPLRAIILTDEELSRKRGAAIFAEEHGVPLIASLLVTAFCRDLTAGGRRPITFLAPDVVELAGARLEFHLLSGDTIDPVFLIVEADGRRLGIVPNGRLDADSVAPLLECDEVLLGNRLELPDGAPSALARRLRSVSNTDRELDELFRGYGGKAIRY